MNSPLNKLEQFEPGEMVTCSSLFCTLVEVSWIEEMVQGANDLYTTKMVTFNEGDVAILLEYKELIKRKDRIFYPVILFNSKKYLVFTGILKKHENTNT